VNERARESIMAKNRERNLGRKNLKRAGNAILEMYKCMYHEVMPPYFLGGLKRIQAKSYACKLNKMKIIN